jgi:hypothetical protein
VIANLLNNNRMARVVAGGVFLMAAAALMNLVRERKLDLP